MKPITKGMILCLSAVMLAGAVPASNLMAQELTEGPSDTGAASVRTSDTVYEAMPDDYIAEQLQNSDQSMIQIKLLDHGTQSITKDTLIALDEADKMLRIEMYESTNSEDSHYTWIFYGNQMNYGGYIPCADQIPLHVTINGSQLREKIDSIFDSEATYTLVEMDYHGLLPDGTLLSVPTNLDLHEIVPVYSYNENIEWLVETAFKAGYLDANTSYGWVLGIRPDYGRDYVLTNDTVPERPVDPDDIVYSDMKEMEEKILTDAKDPEKSEITVKAGISMPDIDTYKLSVPTLQAVKESGKVLHITFPGAEASAEYTWTFDGSAMGEISKAVDLVVTYPSPSEDIESMITNEAVPFVLDFRHSGVLPSGTSFTTGGLGDTVQDGAQGYLYYLNDTSNAKQLEYVGNVTFSTVEDAASGYVHGYGTIRDLRHCSTYVITATRAEGPNVVYPQQQPADTEEPAPSAPTDTDVTHKVSPTDSDTSAKNGTSAPKTGDISRLSETAFLFVLSAAVTTICLWRKRKSKL